MIIKSTIESKKVSMYHLDKMIAEKDTSGMQKTPYVINGYHVMVKIVYRNDAIPEEFIDVVEADLTEGGCTTVNRGDTRDGGRFFFCISKIGDRVMIRLERNMLEYAFNDDVKYNLAFLNA